MSEFTPVSLANPIPRRTVTATRLHRVVVCFDLLDEKGQAISQVSFLAEEKLSPAGLAEIESLVSDEVKTARID